MKILFALDKYSSRAGGADRLARGVVAALLDAGHTLRVLEAAAAQGRSPATAHERLAIFSRPLPRPALLRDSDLVTIRWNAIWSGIVEEAIGDFFPDLVLTQNRLAPATVAAAKRRGVANAIFFHGYGQVSPTFFQGQDALACDPPGFWSVPLRFRLKWPLTKRVLALHAAAFRHADTVIANSGYTARVIERFFGRPAAVLYPVLDLVAPAGMGHSCPDGPILFVKPQAVKGVGRLLAIAAAMPEQRFVVAGKASDRIRRVMQRLANVEAQGWTEDMGELYRASSLLLAPAAIPEPFGRVFVEAGLQGVPSVATAAGGIPEAVGAGGILLPMDAPVAEWRAALIAAREPGRHAALSAAASSHARELLAGHGAARLRQVLSLPGSMHSGDIAGSPR